MDTNTEVAIGATYKCLADRRCFTNVVIGCVSILCVIQKDSSKELFDLWYKPTPPSSFVRAINKYFEKSRTRNKPPYCTGTLACGLKIICWCYHDVHVFERRFAESFRGEQVSRLIGTRDVYSFIP